MTNTNTKTKFICVMDYRTCEVRFYNVEVDAKDFDSFDAESWLNENTSYNSDCYYMVCNEAMKVSHENAKIETTEKESLNSKLRFIGFETGIFNLLLKKVNEFINSDECGEFIDFDFKVTEHNHHFVYSGFVKYRAPKTKHISNDVKEFASEVRKTIEDTYQSLGGSEHFSFEDHGLALIEAVHNKLDEVLK